MSVQEIAMHSLVAADAPSAGNGQLILAAVLGIAAVVLLITLVQVHPFLALILGSAVLGLVAAFGASKTLDSFGKGVGATVTSVGLLIAIGAMIGGLLADSGGADEIVDTIVSRVSHHALPWAMVGAAALIGLPLFFEIGVVLLVPVVLLVAARRDVPLMKVGIPALAGLSVLHGLVPPHPGPLVAISALKADLGLTLLYGIVIAIPTVIIAGPLLGSVIARHVHAEVPAALVPTRQLQPVGAGEGSADLGEPDDESVRSAAVGSPGGGEDTSFGRRRPAFGPVVATVLLPVVLMLARAIADLTLDDNSSVKSALDVIGNPTVALLAGVLVAMVTMGWSIGASRSEAARPPGGALPPIAGILLIVAAGGGFKQVLVDSGVGNVVAEAAKDAHINALLLGWLVAVGIRVATGSATVATITAAGIVAPLATTLDKPTVSLLALAIGCGSLFFSHVNDAGFWLVKEYFGMTVGQTIKTWSVMETIISVVGFACVMILNLIV